MQPDAASLPKIAAAYLCFRPRSDASNVAVVFIYLLRSYQILQAGEKPQSKLSQASAFSMSWYSDPYGEGKPVQYMYMIGLVFQHRKNFIEASQISDRR